MPETWIIIEASHLFRAGDVHKTQFFVMDVVNFLRHKFFPGEVHTIVLHGSTKEDQAKRYAQALERHNVKVVRMNPIPSKNGSDRVYYKPTYYCHQMLGTEIPLGSNVVLIGFHNNRYLDFLKKYRETFKISIAAFSTPNKHQGTMRIPKEFIAHVEQAIDLDPYVSAIKAEWKNNSNKRVDNSVNP
jgi:hypothetical protein